MGAFPRTLRFVNLQLYTSLGPTVVTADFQGDFCLLTGTWEQFQKVRESGGISVAMM